MSQSMNTYIDRERQIARHRSFQKDWTVIVNTGLSTPETHVVRARTAHAATRWRSLAQSIFLGYFVC
jgi:hypothetical protein